MVRLELQDLGRMAKNLKNFRRGLLNIYKNSVPIRLTEEKWFHITEEHSEMAGYYFEVLETVEEPEAIYKGKAREGIVVREIDKGNML